MTTEKEQLEAEIAQRDERIAELEGLMAWQAKAIQEEREAYAMSMKDLQTSAVHLLFDGPPGPECGRFVEAEDPTGKSINAGEWSQRPDGYWQLVIQQPSAGGAYSSDPLACSGCAAGCFRCRSSAGVVLPERAKENEGNSYSVMQAMSYNQALDEVARLNPPRKFRLRDPVRKTKGSQWSGRVVGFYSTEQTPDGYAVESFTEKGSVQIYPGSALEPCEESGECVAVPRELSSIVIELCDAIENQADLPLNKWALKSAYLIGKVRALLAQQGKAVGDE